MTFSHWLRNQIMCDRFIVFAVGDSVTTSETLILFHSVLVSRLLPNLLRSQNIATEFSGCEKLDKGSNLWWDKMEQIIRLW